jgi:hypothetical protein
VTVRVLGTAWDLSGASGGTLLVLLAIADAATNDGVAWMFQETLAAKSRQHTRHVERCLDWLQDNQEIEVWKFRPPTGGPVRYGYRILLGEFVSDAGVPPPELQVRARDGAVKPHLMKTARRRVLERDEHRCRHCRSTDRALDAVIPAGQSAADALTLCKVCAALPPDILSGESPDRMSGGHPTSDASFLHRMSGDARVSSELEAIDPSRTLAAPSGRGGRADHVWDALAVELGAPTNRNEEKRRGTAVSLIRESLRATAVEHGRDPDTILRDPEAITKAIRSRCRRWTTVYPQASLTDTALANRWGELRPPRAAAAPAAAIAAEPEPTAAELEERRQAGLAAIAAMKGQAVA